MTVYFSVIPEITPALLQWARAEAAQRSAERAQVRTINDLNAYKKRLGLRRRQTGLSRETVRRLMEAVEAEAFA